ncbi:MAG TPA: hypothetical protein PK659_05545 [Methanothrix sp.]|nr:hypothetical protein [Methanothrix sp.]HOK58530.1 hypothetical protein [Methanothrix sp.]HOL43699.1 hypothetical protein [Methanothrix sp.]HPO88743.1 hypothetical protein [Methanothrix sp.]
MEEVERQLNLILLEIASLEERIWDCMERLREKELLSPHLEEYVRSIMSELSYWTALCTTASEAPHVLLRRMEVHLTRARRLSEHLEQLSAACA